MQHTIGKQMFKITRQYNVTALTYGPPNLQVIFARKIAFGYKYFKVPCH